MCALLVSGAWRYLHLHRLAEEVTSPLLVKDLLINLAGCDVVILGQGRGEKAG